MEPLRTIPMIRSGDLIFWRYDYPKPIRTPEKREFRLKNESTSSNNKPTPPTVEDMSLPGYWHSVGMLMNIDNTTYVYCMGVLPRKPVMLSLSDFIARCKGTVLKPSQTVINGPIESYQICPQISGLLPVLEDRLKGRIAQHIQAESYIDFGIVDDTVPVVELILIANLMKEPCYNIDKLWRNIKGSRWKYSHSA